MVRIVHYGVMATRRTRSIPRSSLRIGRSSAGLGLFATERIDPGMFIEYTGTLITSAEADARPRARYLFEVNKAWTIDGGARSNLARYINHACAPNCASSVVGRRVFITAQRAIAVGEELTYDYGEEYVDCFIRTVGCRCAACARMGT